VFESKFFEKFSKLARLQEAGEFVLEKDYMLVERIPEPELKTKSGLVLQSPGSDHRITETDALRAQLGLVLLVGQGTEGSAVKPGAVVLLNPYGIRWYTQFPGISTFVAKDLGLSLVSEAHLYYPSIQALEAVIDTLAD
jgi:hypothetical protein